MHACGAGCVEEATPPSYLILASCRRCLPAAEECDHMMTKAGPRLTRSGVVDVDNPGGESVRCAAARFVARGRQPPAPPARAPTTCRPCMLPSSSSAHGGIQPSPASMLLCCPMLPPRWTCPHAAHALAQPTRCPAHPAPPCSTSVMPLCLPQRHPHQLWHVFRPRRGRGGAGGGAAAQRVEPHPAGPRRGHPGAARERDAQLWWRGRAAQPGGRVSARKKGHVCCRTNAVKPAPLRRCCATRMGRSINHTSTISL